MVRTPQGTACVNKYSTLIEPFFAAEGCSALVKTALETTVRTQCPSTAVGSIVWTCMNGWNGTAVDPGKVLAWISFIRGCEILYIAQRVNSAESEDGFMYLDNSCFPRFTSAAAFEAYLSTPPFSTPASTPGSSPAPGPAPGPIPTPGPAPQTRDGTPKPHSHKQPSRRTRSSPPRRQRSPRQRG
ncbi:hypothetical protein HYH02_002509 [Chlamydomonas schloesseri]|uniref:Uncharacterized protein n=1 Tax=Chlamydomonas schloesseri TaxID=2026947 RepID=A0A836BBR3_9CHLO|nr:hypothetical protein HYH02_002509 [Chlamydomonas schloesseri]|eukprot:KAG2453185.1 hypothetical protein HYH02_002509 [Chlamydomonas schloesseri]